MKKFNTKQQLFAIACGLVITGLIICRFVVV